MPNVIAPDLFIEAETYITDTLKSKGYIVQGLGYHSYFSEIAKEAIRQLNEPTSLYIRTLPDNLVIGDLGTMLIEIKDASKRENIAIEAFPFLIGRHLWWKFGLLTLYLFFDGNNISGDFAENLPIDRVILPKRTNLYQSSNWLNLLNESFPTIQIERKATGGSGDPLLIINEDKRQLLKPLGDLL